MRAISNYLAAALVFLAGSASAPAQAPAGTPVRYVQAPTGSALTFTFSQLGAATEGRFREFRTELAYDPDNLTAGSLDVTVQMASLDTQDAERDGVLMSPELFDTARFATARLVADSLARGPRGIEAIGRLTIRGVTRDLRLPLSITPTAAGLTLSGETTIRRLAFGVGQGDWKSTESVADEVQVKYKVTMVRAR